MTTPDLWSPQISFHLLRIKAHELHTIIQRQPSYYSVLVPNEKYLETRNWHGKFSSRRDGRSKIVITCRIFLLPLHHLLIDFFPKEEMKGKKSGGQGLNFNIRYFGWNSPKIESYIRRNTDSWSSPWRLPLKFWYGHLLEMFYLRLYIFGRWDIKLSLCRKDFG